MTNLYRNSLLYSNSAAEVRKSKKVREFIHSVHASRCLRRGDLVLILVPEDLEVLQTVDASLHGRMAYIMDECSPEKDEVQLCLRPSKKTRKTIKSQSRKSNSPTRPCCDPSCENEYEAMSQWMYEQYTNTMQQQNAGDFSKDEQSIVTVPKFCLHLEECVLRKRLQDMASVGS
jgi:hypothetical protein